MVTTIPTIGFNVETVEYKNLSFTVGLHDCLCFALSNRTLQLRSELVLLF